MTHIGASPEVLKHHGEAHARSCPDSTPVEMACSHRTTIIIACSDCRQAVYLVTWPHATECHHAAEIREGHVPSGIWTEVVAA
jgi:hypothetical protein